MTVTVLKYFSRMISEDIVWLSIPIAIIAIEAVKYFQIKKWEEEEFKKVKKVSEELYP